jgi:hypothetical protein
MPVYVDPALDDWPSVGALNNLCIKMNAECEGPYKLKVTGVEFKLFITIHPDLKTLPAKAPWDPDTVIDDTTFLGIYGHEQVHVAQLIDEIQAAKKREIEDFLSTLDGISPCDCESFLWASLPTFTQGIWTIVGPAFMHNWGKGGESGRACLAKTRGSASGAIELGSAYGRRFYVAYGRGVTRRCRGRVVLLHGPSPESKEGVAGLGIRTPRGVPAVYGG